jgi:hypothetical protein
MVALFSFLCLAFIFTSFYIMALNLMEVNWDNINNMCIALYIDNFFHIETKYKYILILTFDILICIMSIVCTVETEIELDDRTEVIPMKYPLMVAPWIPIEYKLIKFIYTLTKPIVDIIYDSDFFLSYKKEDIRARITQLIMGIYFVFRNMLSIFIFNMSIHAFFVLFILFE